MFWNAERQAEAVRWRAKRALTAAGRIRIVRTASIAAALLVATSGAARAQAPASQSPAEICLAANRTLSLGAPLAHTAARLKSGGPLKIVAIGSSSTAGLWVWSAAATYPGVMRRELAVLRPKSQVEILNTGRIGETVGGSIARFEQDVLVHGPDLVVWQLGTNDVAWGGRADGLRDQVIQGVRTLKAGGADVILMDLQYSPLVLASSHHQIMLAIIAEAAQVERVGLFSRFALMRRAVDAGLSRGALVSWDGLHNSADGYECIGRALARAVHAIAR